jgi:hypothetical protein
MFNLWALIAKTVMNYAAKKQQEREKIINWLEFKYQSSNYAI